MSKPKAVLLIVLIVALGILLTILGHGNKPFLLAVRFLSTMALCLVIFSVRRESKP